ncbi:hypothetical protein D3C80_1792900 [compost metagenome]
MRRVKQCETVGVVDLLTPGEPVRLYVRIHGITQQAAILCQRLQVCANSCLLMPQVVAFESLDELFEPHDVCPAR